MLRKKRENYYCPYNCTDEHYWSHASWTGAPLILQINTASVNFTHIDAYIQTFSPVDDQKQIKLQLATKQVL